MSAHTPGPWEVTPEKDEGNFAHSIYGDGYKGLLIARCNQNGSHDADAHLIAAAPELFALASELEDYFDQRSDADCDHVGFIPNEEMRILVSIRAAIAKAEGRAA